MKGQYGFAPVNNTTPAINAKEPTRKEATSLIKEINKLIILFILALVSLFAFPLPYLLTEED
jgi:hypothetical protein